MNDAMETLLKEIAMLTQNIEFNYPELYRDLGEEKSSFAPEMSAEITETDLKTHYELLKMRLKNYLEVHHTPSSDKSEQ